MELRLNVDDNFIKKLEKDLNYKKATQVAADALTLLNWAVNEIKAGRVILSSDNNGESLKRLAMPSFESLQAQQSSNYVPNDASKTPDEVRPTVADSAW